MDDNDGVYLEGDLYPEADTLADIAEDLRTWTPEQNRRAAIEWEAETTNLRMALGRTVFDHVVIQMMVAAGRGVDPSEVIETFAREVVT